MPGLPSPNDHTQTIHTTLRRSFLVFVCICLLGGWIITIDANKYIETQKQAALKLSGAQASDLSQRLNAAISLAYTLEVILRENQFEVNPEHFEILATQLMQAQPAVSSLQYAPGGVVTYVVPLQGNEAIIGHDLLSDPTRNKEAFDAIRKHQLTVAGPFELIQGGFALVARLPIFRTEATGETFWGFSTVLVRIRDLLSLSDINKLSDLGYTWNLSRIHPDTGAPHIFAGPAAATLEDTMQLVLKVPNATWYFTIKPREGWLAGHYKSMTLESVILLIIAVTGACFTFLLLRQPVLLQQQVAQRTNDLRQSEERFRLLFETNPDPVILSRLDDGSIIDVNKAFEVLTGITRLEALGHTSLQLNLWAESNRRDLLMAQIATTGETNNLEAAFRVKGGKIRTGLLSARVLTLNQQQCILITVRDITTEKEAERTLIEMDRMKSEFISAATHELSTPLSAMMGYTEFLLHPEEFGDFTDAQKQDFLREVYDRGEALSRIIDDLLDISRIESGHSVALDLQECRLGEVLSRSVEYYRQQHPQHQFHLHLPGSTEETTVRIDRHRITQVLENLLSNAAKYSARNTEVTVSAQRSPAGWQISVADQGIGMTPEQVAKVFDKFYRVDASNTAIGGLGLGMSIARQIVEGHGGQIAVASRLGQGTTVTFTLPASTVPR